MDITDILLFKVSQYS